MPPPPLPTPPPNNVEFVIKRGTGATGAGPSAASVGSQGTGSSGGGGSSEPKSDDIVEVKTNNIQRTPPAEPEKETQEPEPPKEQEEETKEKTKPNMDDFIQQMKEIQLIMIASSIALVITVFFIRARGILF